MSSAAEAVRALCVIIPGFERYFAADGAQYAIFIGKENIAREALGHPSGKEDIRIAPIPAGSKKNGLIQVILGVVLVVVGVWTANPTLVQIGVGLAIGGAITMLSPQPRINDGSDPTENRASYMFNGAVNTVAQGNPVAYFAGLLRVGSCVISAGIYNENR